MDPATIIIYLFPLVIGLLAYVKNALDLVGSVVGIALGYALLIEGVNWFSLMLGFFVIGTIVTRIGYSKKKKLGQHQKTRGILNVLGNSLVGVVMAFLGNPGGASAAFAAATADTASSEIGLLSREKPKSILTWRQVSPGYNGGITTLGCTSMIICSGIFSLIPWYFWGPKVAVISFLSGIFGSILDSILGDAFESKGKWGNHTTNFLATLGAGLVGYILYLLL